MRRIGAVLSIFKKNTIPWRPMYVMWCAWWTKLIFELILWNFSLSRPLWKFDIHDSRRASVHAVAYPRILPWLYSHFSWICAPKPLGEQPKLTNRHFLVSWVLLESLTAHHANGADLSPCSILYGLRVWIVKTMNSLKERRPPLPSGIYARQHTCQRDPYISLLPSSSGTTATRSSKGNTYWSF